MALIARLAVVWLSEQCPTSPVFARADTTILILPKYATPVLLLVWPAVEPTPTIALPAIAPSIDQSLSTTLAPAWVDTTKLPPTYAQPVITLAKHARTLLRLDASLATLLWIVSYLELLASAAISIMMMEATNSVPAVCTFAWPAQVHQLASPAMLPLETMPTSPHVHALRDTMIMELAPVASLVLLLASPALTPSTALPAQSVEQSLPLEHVLAMPELSNLTAMHAYILAFPASLSVLPAQLAMAQQCVTSTPTHPNVSAIKATSMMAPIKCVLPANILASLAVVLSPASLALSIESSTAITALA